MWVIPVFAIYHILHQYSAVVLTQLDSDKRSVFKLFEAANLWSQFPLKP